MFRAQLILHEKVREVFESSLRLARQSGYLKKRGMRVALDTTYILGRGAVKDTYNLLADGIVKLLRALAAVANIPVGEWAAAQRYERYLGSSIKGEAVIDWSDRKARAALLAELVADADRLLELARRAWVELPEDSVQRQSIVDGAELLGQLLLQDIERKSGDADAHADDGVSRDRDRMPSVHDPELRHGHQSSRRRFDWHKAAIVVDTDSQLITAVDVLPGNAPDNLGHWNWWSRAKRVPARWWRKPWAMRPMGTAGPARPSPTRDAGWWPKCRAGPTGATFPRMTFTLTWRRAVAPVRRDRLPAPSCQRESGLTAPVASTACRLSSSTGRYVGYVHCGPSASRPKAGRDAGC